MKKRIMLLSQQRLSTKVLDLVKSTFFKPNELQKKEILSGFISLPYTYWTSSGREALRQILKKSGAKKVGVPAFTCHVVLDAVKRAGCEPVFYDSGIIADEKDIEKIIKKVDALLICYNFGFMPDMTKISELCRKNKVILIEDCAQALGAKCDSRLAGSFGDYAFYSFGISKNISFCGGLIASKKELNLEALPQLPVSKLFKIIIEVLIAPFFFNKYIYSTSSKLLKNELEKEQEALSYSLPKLAQGVILYQMQRYDKILQLRKTNEDLLIGGLSRRLKGRLSEKNYFLSESNCHSSGLYFVLLNKNRNKIKDELLNRGVEFGVMNTFHCFDKGFVLAKKAEEEHLTFALYRPSKEIKLVKDTLLETLHNKNE